ncbi:hypothetical protein D3C85_1218550 [compost metagenome]
MDILSRDHAEPFLNRFVGGGVAAGQFDGQETRFAEQPEPRELLFQLRLQRLQPTLDRQRAFQFVDRVLAHAVGDANVERALEEPASLRMVERAHRGGGGVAFASGAEIVDKPLGDRLLNDRQTEQVTRLQRMHRHRCLVAGRRIPGNIAQQGVRRQGRDGFHPQAFGGDTKPVQLQ